MNRKLRNYYFGPQGSIYTKFSKQNEPTEARFKELFDSQAFIAEVADTAKTNEQGLIKLDSDADVIARTLPVTGAMAEAVQAHQLPELVTALNIITDTVDSSQTLHGLTIKQVTRQIGAYSRRIWNIINDMIFTSSDGTVGVDTTTTDGTVDLTVNITSSGGTITPTKIAGGWNLETNPGVGPAGEDVIGLSVSSAAYILCDNGGTPIGALPTVTARMFQGNTHIDLTSIDLLDVTEFNPVVSNCTATYAHSGTDINVTFTAITADNGSVILNIKYLGSWYSITVAAMKIKAGASGTTWVYKGELVAAPANPVEYWWYKNPNTEITYFYEGGAWKVLIDNRDVGTTTYVTLTNAGLNVALTAAVPQTYIVHVPAGVVLAAPIDITASGVFPDGYKLRVTFDGGFDMNGQAVTIFGKVYSKAQCAIGNIQRQIVYSITDTSWKMLVSNNDVWELGAGTNSAQTVGTLCNATGLNSVSEGLNSGASGNDSHSEGYATLASGVRSHAQGSLTVASGNSSHAEGYQSESIGHSSHAQGYASIARADYSNAEGKESVAHIVASSAFASAMFAIPGDCQELKLFLKKVTADATPADMLLAFGGTGIEIPTDCIVDFECRYTALQTAGVGGTIGDCVTQKITFSVQNLAGTLTLLTQGIATTATVVTVAGDIVYYESATIGALAATCVPVISGTKVLFVVTGEATKDVQHSCLVSMNINGFRNFVI